MLIQATRSATLEITAVGRVTNVQFSHDGRRVFVTAEPQFDSNEGGGIWQLPAPALWKDVLCDKLTSNPSDEQWKEWISPDIPNTDLCPGKPRPDHP
jgi:hypothetical protein